MMIRFSFAVHDAANAIESAVTKSLARGARTRDIAVRGETYLSTAEMGDAILKALKE